MELGKQKKTEISSESVAARAGAQDSGEPSAYESSRFFQKTLHFNRSKFTRKPKIRELVKKPADAELHGFLSS
jgi:hypothetical protein